MSRIGMKRKQLVGALGSLDGFSEPKVLLEQYALPAEVAADILRDVVHLGYDDLSGKLVADLGCGSGVLAIGAALLGARHVVAFDIDDDALSVASENVADMELDGQVDFVKCDVINLRCGAGKLFDTIVMNPPYGTKKNEGRDVEFLQTALRLCRGYVYSIHKSSTRDYLEKKAKDWGVPMTVDKTFKNFSLELPKTMRFHKKDAAYVKVDLLRFECSKK
ncbi:rRNA N6-adenosine-methyltransferase METTL5-like [Oscarella lobularis]|uniref:rRNA N6-adenosine-methyltransferase METTL5-like n=1 Tax=Oscarella lobularis TaxID=121494 RepID=UPI00331403DC